MMPPYIRCPVGGEDWPMTALQWYQERQPFRDRQTYHTITFDCPVGHTFDLEKAVQSGLLAPEHARNLWRGAQRKHQWRIRRPYAVLRMDRRARRRASENGKDDKARDAGEAQAQGG